MLAEARNLHKNGLSFKRMHALGLEYGHLSSVLEGRISKEEFEQVLANDIWHFVKRQRTWFKRRKEIVWFKPNKANFKKIENVVKKFLGTKGSAKPSTGKQKINAKNRSTIN